MSTDRRRNRTNVRRLVTTVAAVGAAALLLGACAGSGGSDGGSAPGGTPAAGTPRGGSAGTPVKGGNLTIQMSQDPGSLDPIASGNINDHNIALYLYQSLFVMNADNEPTPDALASYTKSKDGLTYTFKLRSGLVFSDGSPVTSADVVASMKYWMTLGVGPSVKARLTSLTAPDDLTTVVKLTKPFPLLMAFATSPSSPGLPIFKAANVAHVGAKGFTKAQAIGSGPYKLKSWTAGQQVVLERNDSYRSRTEAPSGYAGARHAYFDTITFKVVKDQAAAINGLKTGQWDVITTAATDQYTQLKGTSGVQVGILSAGGRTDHLYLNHHSGSIFANAKARDALNLAIDKKAVLLASGPKDLIEFDGSHVASSDEPLYSTAGEDVYNAHDPQKAKKLFAEAGYKSGQTIRLITTGEFPQFGTWATVIQDELSKIGVKVSIGSYDFSTMISKATANEWDMMALDGPANVVLPKQSIPATGLLPAIGAKGGYDSPAMNAAMDAYVSAVTDADRQQAADQIQALIWKDKPAIVLGLSKAYVAYSSKLAGYDHYGMDFWNAWLAK